MNYSINCVLSKLEKVRSAGDGKWSACCPAHDDRDPSLSVSLNDAGDRLLVHCHAGCSIDAVLVSLGIEYRDLFCDDGSATTTMLPPKPAKSSKGKLAFASLEYALAHYTKTYRTTPKVWTYTNAAGEVVGVVARWDAAGGKQLRPFTYRDGRWYGEAFPEPRPLLNLPDVASADLLLIVEGETCADTITGMGMASVTSAGGSNAARLTDWSPLSGKDVVLLPDCDDAGDKYANTVAETLSGLNPPARVRILRLPGLGKGEDVVEWVEKHGGNATPTELQSKLLELIEKQAEPWSAGETQQAPNTGDGVQVQPVAEEPEVREATTTQEPYPPQLLEVPGLIGDFVRYCRSVSVFDQPLLALAGGIALQAVLAGRKVCGAYSANRPHVYLVGLAPTGFGKDMARVCIRRILEQAKSRCDASEYVPVGIFDNPRSGSSLARQLVDTPAALLLVDEIGDFLRTVYAKNAHWANDIGTHLLRLYSAGEGRYSGAQYSDSRQNISVERPSLTFFGVGNPSAFWQYLDPGAVRHGLLPRILLFPGDNDPPLQDDDKDETVPTAILDHCAGWLKRGGLFANFPGGGEEEVVPFTPGARALAKAEYRDRHEAQRRRKRDSVSSILHSRLMENALRLSVVYACSQSFENPVVTEDGLRWGLTLATWSVQHAIREVDNNLGENEYDVLRIKILAFIRANPKGVSRTALCHKFQTARVRDRDEALKSLLESGQIVEETATTGGRRASIYYPVPEANA